ncbi:putative purple acid phosphatase 20 [Micractinium conductrix]|uniref:Purple acid phosphatase n=1 Tax=Micractinium conductrix TaxID=554055 RepID=A0A2P6VD00_9CHLO|nr:putative purple acid phosphatase 20 [Micractinium conductrix]|eukprot:PSC71931.1 putative purple acid phosphatase 20 [Micractinium conductrix]
MQERTDWEAALPPEHPRLARSTGADAHAPEQVHLAFAGPSSYAVTWMTHPLDDPAAALAAEAALGETATSGGSGDAGLASRRLAAATAAAAAAQLRLGADALEAGAAADASLERRHRHRRRRGCRHVQAAAERSVVQYGLESGEYQHTVESPDTVGCYSSGSYLSGAIHRVIVGAGDEGPLPPNSTIFYRVGDPSQGWSREFSFKTAPLVGPDTLPYRLGVIGDLGQTDHSLSTLDHLTVSAPESILLTGDLSYADGYQPRWDTWVRMVENFTASMPWMYCVGNHEIELTDGVKDFVAYENRFYFPYRQSLSTSKLYYSYDVAGAHIIMLSSYSPYSPASEQYAWLMGDLAGVDRGRTPWLIVSYHAPWYNSNYAHQGEGDGMRESMEALLYQHGVDFIFAGHVHAYERNERVYQSLLDECAPVHINIGDGGNKEGPDKKYYQRPPYSAFREPSFGHGTLDLLDTTHAEWRWHRNQDSGPEDADFVSIFRNPDCKPQLDAVRQQAAAAAQQRRQQQAGVEEEAEAAELAAERHLPAEQQQLAAAAGQRPCFQPRSGGGWGGGGGGGLGRLLSNPDTVLWGLIGLNLGGFVMWRLNGPMMATHATVSIEGLRAGRAWTVLTSAFSHRDFGHLAANMLGLFFFGRDIGRLFGGRKLLALYLAGGALGSLAHCGWYYYKACQTGEGRYGRARWFGFTPSALGASAAVNAITVVDILLYPTRTILLYGIIPLPAALLGALWLFRDISGTLDGVGHIAHAGHLGGAATGLAFYLAYRRGMIRPRGW